MSMKTECGGMFNSYKAKYSAETHQLLKVLMEEAKLTTAQRHQMKGFLNRGEPFPAVVKKKAHRPSYVDENLFGLKRNYHFLRRSREQIINSGAYEMENHVFIEDRGNFEKEKEKLQNIMSCGKNKKNWATLNKGSGTNLKAKTDKVKETQTVESRIEELITEVEERIEFLNEMKALDSAKPYEMIINQEVAAKLRELRILDKNVAEKYLNQIRAPNPFEGRRLSCSQEKTKNI